MLDTSADTSAFHIVDGRHTRLTTTFDVRGRKYKVDAVIDHQGYPGRILHDRSTFELVDAAGDEPEQMIARDLEIAHHGACVHTTEHSMKHKAVYVEQGRADVIATIIDLTSQLQALEPQLVALVQSGASTSELWLDAERVLRKREAQKLALRSYEQRHRLGPV